MIKRKDGRWQEQIKLPGMERPKYFYGRTQREVQRKLAAWSMEREQEQAQAVQLCTIVEQWAERHQEEISASSWQSYPAAVRDVIQWFEGREIGDVYPDEITDFLQAIATRGYSRRTVQRRRDVLTLVWDEAPHCRRMKQGRRVEQGTGTRAWNKPGLSLFLVPCSRPGLSGTPALFPSSLIPGVLFHPRT